MGGAVRASATELKRELGKYLDLARTGRVVIERQGRPIAVLISIEEYEALNPSASRTLDLLTEEYDALVARMQSPSFEGAIESAFAASPAASRSQPRAAAAHAAVASSRQRASKRRGR
jgi:prevent-host-death family protein